MKATYRKLGSLALVAVTLTACSKHEGVSTTESSSEAVSADAAMVSDSISTAATMTVKDKQFVKTADVDMEVKDVYDATIKIEGAVQELRGFVTHSNLTSNIVEQNTYNTSDTEAVMIKKYKSENNMEVRVPTENLGVLLQKINDQKLFLNARVINAEDVTAAIKYAELEQQRVKNNSGNIQNLKNGKDKVNLSNENDSDKNMQALYSMERTDQIKYSTVKINLEEPSLKVAQIPVVNTKNMDNQYKINFFYDMKNSFVEGFHFIQLFIIGLMKIWPFLLIGGVVVYFLRKRKRAQIGNPS